MSFLLDTNVVSEIRRGRDPYVRAWTSAVEDDELYLSALTLGEIRQGIEGLRERDPAQAACSSAGSADCTPDSPTGSSRSTRRWQRNGDA